MKQLVYATGSSEKFNYVTKLLAELPLVLVQQKVHVDEIQSDDPLSIAARKAHDAFQVIQEPLFVTDTFWAIPALNGFPGAYMKDVNNWFTVHDFLKLLEGKADRRIVARDVISYIDSAQTKQFVVELEGILATVPRKETGNSLDNIAQFGGVYLGDIKEKGLVIGDENDKWGAFKEFLKTTLIT